VDCKVRGGSSPLGRTSESPGNRAFPGLFRRAPREHVEHLPERDIERDWLRRAELPRYLGGCSEVYRTLAELLMATGMRTGARLGGGESRSAVRIGP
jgi:hypothetical protein